jgi:hypothetical protein
VQSFHCLSTAQDLYLPACWHITRQHADASPATALGRFPTQLLGILTDPRGLQPPNQVLEQQLTQSLHAGDMMLTGTLPACVLPAAQACATTATAYSKHNTLPQTRASNQALLPVQDLDDLLQHGLLPAPTPGAPSSGPRHTHQPTGFYMHKLLLRHQPQGCGPRALYLWPAAAAGETMSYPDPCQQAGGQEATVCWTRWLFSLLPGPCHMTMKHLPPQDVPCAPYTKRGPRARPHH